MSLQEHARLMMLWLLSVSWLALSAPSQAAELNLADAPLFLGSSVEANVFFMMDDSGSMDWEVLTVDHHYYRDYWDADNTRGLEESGLAAIDADEGDCQDLELYYYVFSSDANSNSDNVYDSTCDYPALEDQGDSTDHDWRMLSADFNVLYYDPRVTYEPWPGFPDADYSSVRSNPQPGTSGYSKKRSLKSFKYEVWIDDKGADLDNNGEVKGPDVVTDIPNGLVDLWDSRTTYVVKNNSVKSYTHTTGDAATIKAGTGTSSQKSTKSKKKSNKGGTGEAVCTEADVETDPPYVNCFHITTTEDTIKNSETDPWGRTTAEIQQNVANWYQYHRRRSFVAKGAVSEVILSNDAFRFGLSQINEYAEVFVEVPAANVDDFTSHNNSLLQSMYNYEWQSNGTPLRRGLERVGRYYDDYSGYNYADPIIAACQQNYSVLMTDGYWNGDPPEETQIGDEDNDGESDTVADVAHYFYTEDLSPLPDEVPATARDPNTKQHMVTFTVAFGVDGNLVDTDSDGEPNPALAENGDWTNGAVNTDPEKIDDLWHGAFNSKGSFVSARSPDEVADAIHGALQDVGARVGSAASVATNSGSLNTGSKLVQARFDSGEWNGQLMAFQINLDGSVAGTASWDAADQVSQQNHATGREIITWNPEIDSPNGGRVEGSGIAFHFPSDYTDPNDSNEMSDSQVTYLLDNAPHNINTNVSGEIAANQDFGRDIVDYLRGDDTHEGGGRNFRSRTNLLGDIVNSSPRFVGAPKFRYPDAMEADSYDDFKSTHASRDGVVYVGANDGMLHAFDGDTGDEVLAYVPGAVYRNLDRLAETNYQHRYYVDGSPNAIDVYLDDVGNNGEWRTVLAGGLGGGGQGVYALDITDPDDFDEANASSLVLWEFDDGDDADLGYTYGNVQLAKMNDGTWAAVFGNGYNNTESDGNASSSGHAVLYIVDVETGELLKKIDTEAGAAGTPNGLATPLLIDIDQDFDVDYIYAGDLLGNMWKFDVTAGSTTGWDVAWTSGGDPAPLFTTANGQPITSQPQATFHPDNLDGFMLFFGTGRYLAVGDNVATGQTTQTFYGIWDKNGGLPSINPSTDLLSQSITNQFDQAFDTDNNGSNDTTYTLRTVSDNVIDWTEHDGWKMDLFPEQINGATNTANFGERQVTQALVRGGRVIFTTLVPSSAECDFGGTSFLMEVDYRDGSSLEFPAFDLNGDGEYDADDSDAAGLSSSVGIMPSVSLLSNHAVDIAFGSGASGDIQVIELTVGDQAYGRQSWRMLE